MEDLLEVFNPRKRSRLLSPISTLPVELVLIIANFLSPKDLSHLLQTCHFFSCVVEPHLYAIVATEPVPARPPLVLYWAAERGYVSVLQKVFQYSKPDEIPVRCKTRALSHAAEHGQTAAAKFLLDVGAKINRVVSIDDVNRYTALHRAAANGHADMVIFLLDNGANPAIQGSPDEVAVLEHADSWGQKDMVQLFLSRGFGIKKPPWAVGTIYHEDIDQIEEFLE
ncbi:ankyrin repeat-containing domain protein [Aspergillus pseudodeflectus]|uniref:Ankyrin repeat-containing domain protein n=1 Tax=Aspergillus pseudodeflectus TaxID=176178 RepID=A0ABR4L6I0_9EURO